jgi:hypothetical protein
MAGVGTRIDVMTGKAHPAATPIFRTTALRDSEVFSCSFRVTSNPDFDNFRKVSQTNSWST